MRVVVICAVLTLGCGGSAGQRLPAHAWVLPARAPSGVVVTIHGGGWVGVGAQDLALEAPDVARYRRAGWAVLNVDYRPGVAAIGDLTGFYDLAHRRFPRLPVCASGRSAGGHLAMMLAVHRPRLACVISLEGPGDLRPLAAGRTIPALAATVRKVFAGRLEAWSPALRLRGYRGRVLATVSPDDRVIPGGDQAPGLRRMARHVHLVTIRGTAEKAPGAASWVHIDPAPGALRVLRRAERALLARLGRHPTRIGRNVIQRFMNDADVPAVR